ncbi:hypothetical protein KC19_6G001700 [Ceratodon purpureus]|uniref:Reverse transcriptase domain-containing protein n=1 Tax=Ceratodon purpureus TaxID=3225 RepID=A0A8T0H8C8_CERPU|nr:hypothetical protein KC19_6G001700 [Ceratodon purpureus]
MATYKQHKHTYRWLTNAFHTVYSNIALLLTVTTVVILDSFKSWAKKLDIGYRNFLGTDTSSFWIVDSVIHVTLNLPPTMHDVYVADITKCYESIPLTGQDNLLEALQFMIRTGFQEAARLHTKAETILWVKFAQDNTPMTARWGTTQPKSGRWIPMSQTRLISLHSWLMNNCFVALGDRVWRQTRGIPMGFSCSPLWCNIYLMTYEVKFIQRLASMGRKDLLNKFRYAFRYIDDICWVNVGNPQDFLSPEQPRTPDNPFWIYPLHILEIKTEVSKFGATDPTQGISAHFMNVQFDLHETDPKNFVMRKYDKRRNLPFKYTQFIKFQSNRPVRQSYNIIISQILPILYISNDTMIAFQEILLLIRTLESNGFQAHRLQNLVTRWLETGTFPSTKTNIQALTLLLKHTAQTQ